MAVGRISGPLLKDNLLRNGVNLAFETDLLYLDVANRRIGVNTSTPTNDLTVNGTTRTTNLQTTTSATLAEISFNGNTISSTNTTINLLPSGSNAVVYQGTISVGNININGNTIAGVGLNANLELTTSGTGVVQFNSNVEVIGNLHATGSITADGNITLGNANTDNVVFTGEINSNIIPNITNTYDLGSSTARWNNVYTNNIAASTVNTTAISVPELQTANLDIIGNTITAFTPNTDVNFVTSGTYGVVIPSGNVANRPLTQYREVGMMRFNTELQLVEIFDGTFWGSVAGSSSGVTGNTAQDIGVQTALALG